MAASLMNLVIDQLRRAVLLRDGAGLTVVEATAGFPLWKLLWEARPMCQSWRKITPPF